MNGFLRPPTPQEAIDWRGVRTTVYPYKDFWTLNMDCMEEALTAEWLIEYGLMPDPTDFHTEDSWHMRCIGIFIQYVCEDRTQ